jgi:tripartite-type tricarboxylate transporter receptor subunit TctC
VPTSPGSAADIGARVVGERLQAILGRPVVAENKVGAGGFLAATAVATSEPNGETVGMLGTSYLLYELDFPQQKFDPLRDIAPIAMVHRSTNVLVVARESPYHSLSDIVQRARAVPGQVKYASAGPGSSTFHSAERVRVAAGLDFVHIPYKGSPEAVREVIAGRVDFAFAPVSVVAGFTQNDLMRILAVSSAKRSRLLPDAPTTVEAGVPGSSYESWLVAVVSANTPPEIQAELNKALNAVLETPEIRHRFESMGVEVAPLALEPLRSLIREEYANAMAHAAANRH